ncbi:unnamed protein product [Callosobruchus maculatus]|uniref:Sodium/calcium exchanger membrane region domain-containing protein n=1 Tax=Callosobruchus maculatus TaxID=64391 RepID=A0A653CD46_CALMS|nr:unnamed protein product [Callosobruchus maculatus]
MGEASLGLILLVSAWTVNCQLEYTPVIQIFYKPVLENELSTKQIDLIIAKPIRQRRFIPFARPLETRAAQDIPPETCDSSSQDDFPQFLTDDIVHHGGFVLCIIIGIYCFTLLAIVCENYFLPCVETICEVLGLTPDVAAATFMSVATSCPELFTNIIGTFVTESDIGIGTIVGSSLFNGLGVAAIGGLAAPFPLKLDWWPLTRDCIIYIVAITALVTITWDGVILWYEAMILVIIYVLYFLLMFQNDRISVWVKRKVKKNQKDLNKNEGQNEKEIVPRVSIISAYGSYLDENTKKQLEANHQPLEKIEEEEVKEAKKSIFVRPKGSLFKKIFFYYSWPIQFALRCTIPNPKLHPRLFPLTFLLCIIWIGANAYVVSWMIAIIGNLLNLPDAVLGMTFLAVGGCLPESISMTIISRRGEGAFGVSNSLGANTMNILMSLGLPWFFKNMLNLYRGIHTGIHIQSGSIEYTILSLIFVSFCLYTVLALNKFRLGKIVGATLLCIYTTMVVLAVLSEMVFFPMEKEC